MKIVFYGLEGEQVYNMRYQQDDYKLLDNEYVYPNDIIDMKTLDGYYCESGKVVYDEARKGNDTGVDIPQWGQDLINVLLSNNVIDDTTATNIGSGLPIKVKSAQQSANK